MTKNEDKAIQAREKREIATETEQTRPGAVFSPFVDIFESPDEITVLADMPGVTTDTLRIDLRDRVLTLEGRVEGPERKDEQPVVSEFTSAGTFFRHFTLSDAIDQGGIDATLADGVLRVTLPKVKEVRPRRIEVKAS